MFVCVIVQMFTCVCGSVGECNCGWKGIQACVVDVGNH